MEKPTILNEMIDILRDTVRFYSEKPLERRAQEQGSCTYWIPETGAKCAVGRLLSQEDLDMLKDSNQLEDTALSDVYQELTTEKVKSLPIRFLEDLQELHDNDSFWDNELNSRGEEYADKILEKINTRVYA